MIALVLVIFKHFINFNLESIVDYIARFIISK